MYSVIDTFQKTILSSTTSEEVSEYDWLRQNLGQAHTAAYQQLYKGFWGMAEQRLLHHLLRFPKEAQTANTRKFVPGTVRFIRAPQWNASTPVLIRHKAAPYS
jgi:hypothetical protein